MILAGIGRYGPFVQHNGAYANLSGVDEVFEVGVNRAVALLAEKRGAAAARRGGEPTALKELGPHPADGQPVRVLAGRYGPYVKHGATNATIARGTDPHGLSLDDAVKLIAEREAKGPAKKGGRGGARGRKRAKAEA
jgi:DNA topoisomerase-1